MVRAELEYGHHHMPPHKEAPCQDNSNTTKEGHRWILEKTIYATTI